MKNYELMLIFDSALDENIINDEVSKITAIIEKSNGNVTKTDFWGIKKLAYPIKHQENGFYVLICFSCTTSVLPELDRINKINDKVLRHMIVKSNEKD